MVKDLLAISNLEEERRRIPLSETITEVEALFEGNLRLMLKSAEQVVQWKPSSVEVDFTIGRVVGYADTNKQELFIYLGLVYVDNHFGRVYPCGFIFATDLEGNKLEKFLTDIQTDKHARAYWKSDARRNLLSEKDFLTSVESHKA